jgi:hypothetical protein
MLAFSSFPAKIQLLKKIIKKAVFMFHHVMRDRISIPELFSEIKIHKNRPWLATIFLRPHTPTTFLSNVLLTLIRDKIIAVVNMGGCLGTNLQWRNDINGRRTVRIILDGFNFNEQLDLANFTENFPENMDICLSFQHCHGEFQPLYAVYEFAPVESCRFENPKLAAIRSFEMRNCNVVLGEAFIKYLSVLKGLKVLILFNVHLKTEIWAPAIGTQYSPIPYINNFRSRLLSCKIIRMGFLELVIPKFREMITGLIRLGRKLPEGKKPAIEILSSDPELKGSVSVIAELVGETHVRLSSIEYTLLRELPVEAYEPPINDWALWCAEKPDVFIADVGVRPVQTPQSAADVPAVYHLAPAPAASSPYQAVPPMPLFMPQNGNAAIAGWGNGVPMGYVPGPQSDA